MLNLYFGHTDCICRVWCCHLFFTSPSYTCVQISSVLYKYYVLPNYDLEFTYWMWTCFDVLWWSFSLSYGFPHRGAENTHFSAPNNCVDLLFFLNEVVWGQTQTFNSKFNTLEVGTKLFLIIRVVISRVKSHIYWCFICSIAS